MTINFKLPNGITFFERGWLSSNNVLLHDTEQAVLIDTGYWTHEKQTAALVQSVLGDKALDLILNTHLHSDHCGGNAYLQDLFPKVQTLIPPGHFNFVVQWDPEALSYIPTGQHCPRFTAQSCLQPGDSFEVAGLNWRVHSAPGHDPHSIILFCHSEGILISADALWEKGFGVVFPEIEGLSAFDEVEATLKLIESLEPRVILPGHGKPFIDVDSAIEFARTRLEGFGVNPVKHSIYAAKVLLKFKLLEMQSVDIDQFINWANSCTFLHQLHAYFKDSEFSNWTYAMCDSLVESGAAQKIGNKLINR